MSSQSISLSERVYAALLRCLPRDFRREFGGDMRDLFRDHLREARRYAGRRGVAALWARTIPDLLFTALQQYEDDMFHAMGQDLRYALRILRQNPLFSGVAVLVIALGVGAVSTIFSVANAVVLRPIPAMTRPENVFVIERTRAAGGNSRSVSYPYVRHLAARAKTIEVAAFDMVPLSMSSGGAGVNAQGNLVTASYFDVVGIRPALGRFFTAAEDAIPDANPIVVISHEFWQRQFAGDSAVIGRSVQLNGRRFTIIGVAPPRFTGLYPVIRIDVWAPLTMQRALRRGDHLLESVESGWLDLVGRVAPGSTPAVASAELAALTKEYASTVERGLSDDFAEFTAVRLAHPTGFPGDSGAPVTVFFVALIAVSGLVLLIASVNVASMLLARGVARRREIAVRIALGAARARLVRQLLTESVLLFAAGGLLGIALSFVATTLIGRIPLPLDVPLVIDPTPDARVLIVSLALALATGLGFGLAPALQASRGDLATALRGDTAGGGRARSRLRNTLVVAQVAASLILLATSGLFVRALARGQRVDPGYDISHIATMPLDVGLSGYDSVRAGAFHRALIDRVRALPGVRSVAYTRTLPLTLTTMGYSIAVPGYRGASGSGGRSDQSGAAVVDEGYFDALRLPIVEGRAFTAADNATAPKVAVVSRRFAEKYWAGESAIGHVFKLDSSTTVTVVGVTRDVKFAKLDERPGPFMYLPIAQHYRADLNLLARTDGDPSALAPLIREAVRALDPTLPQPAVVSLERATSVALLPQRFAAGVTASLGAIGLVLAAIGLYGVLAFSIAQRTREIGVRIALGAVAGQVVRMVVGEGLRLVWIGAAVGLVVALIATRALAPFLFGVDPFDVMTFVLALLILGGAGMVASWIPARRASRADPMTALRHD